MKQLFPSTIIWILYQSYGMSTWRTSHKINEDGDVQLFCGNWPCVYIMIDENYHVIFPLWKLDILYSKTFSWSEQKMKWNWIKKYLENEFHGKLHIIYITGAQLIQPMAHRPDLKWGYIIWHGWCQWGTLGNWPGSRFMKGESQADLGARGAPETVLSWTAGSSKTRQGSVVVVHRFFHPVLAP